MIVVALVMSFVIKRDSEVVDYEDAFGEMKTVDDVNLTDANGMCTLPVVCCICCIIFLSMMNKVDHRTEKWVIKIKNNTV